MNFVSYGWFEGTVAEGEVLVIELPTENCGTVCFTAEDYYIKDLNTGEHSILHIIAPYVPEPEPVVQQPVQQQEPIYNVELVAEIDNSEFQHQLVDLTNSLNTSLETIASQRVQIEGLESNIQSLTAQITTLNSTSVANDESVAKILALEQQVDVLYLNATSTNVEFRSLENDLANAKSELIDVRDNMAQVTQERDEWKVLAHSWYSVAMEQLRVMVEVLGL